MRATHSKSAFLHGQVRRALQSGRYVPGQRIDPATLAAEFGLSLTPVRFALYRLVGEDMIADHARNGFHVPLPNEVAMRALYDWMDRLLIMASELHAVKPSPLQTLPWPAAESDLPKHTWKLFDAMARSTGHGPLHQAVRRTNDRLAPIRRAKQASMDHAAEELAELQQLWQAHDTVRLGHALHAYYERRRQLVPSIVALLAERSNRLH
jgi:DNA-binding GntR family transcriptional regulator